MAANDEGAPTAESLGFPVGQVVGGPLDGDECCVDPDGWPLYRVEVTEEVAGGGLLPRLRRRTTVHLYHVEGRDLVHQGQV
jgi:hypothetical protein